MEYYINELRLQESVEFCSVKHQFFIGCFCNQTDFNDINEGIYSLALILVSVL